MQASLALTGTGLLAGNLFGQKQFINNDGEGPQKHLTCYPDTGGGKHQLYQLWIRDADNTVLTSYRAHPSQKYPYFQPFAGPVSGLSLTSETGRPWPHHRGIFFGLDRVNDGNYWQGDMNRGQIISQGPSFAKGEDDKFKITETSAEIVDHCLWKQPDKEPIIEDHRRFVVKILDEKRYILDAYIDVKALTDITVQQTNHGLFGVRCAPDLAPTGGGHLSSSEGVEGEKETLGKPARWLAFYGKRAKLKEEIVEGIAVFCPSKAPHPTFENCPWFTRDYGNISPTPMLWIPKDKPFTLPKGDELKLRYRVVGFGGTPKEAGLDDLWTEFDNAG
ncbi:hypothetical protein FACS1894189_1250 [Planctomycetales bacterium]|nr:hypothetical protein FACS1894189_1250 [Planctomycetales bacterium]